MKPHWRKQRELSLKTKLTRQKRTRTKNARSICLRKKSSVIRNETPQLQPRGRAEQMSKPIKLRKILTITAQALANVRGGQSTGEPIATFITFGGYDTTDG